MKAKFLEKLNACDDAVKWASKQKNRQQAWDDCERGDWMLWYAGKLSGEPESNKRRKLVLCACECARLALKYVPKGEKRPLKAIETAESWAREEGGGIEDVKYAARAAYAAAGAAADAAAYAAYAAAYAAYVAAYAADAAAYARNKTLLKCVDIVRKHYPKYPKWD